jgi:hypothetical protein
VDLAALLTEQVPPPPSLDTPPPRYSARNKWLELQDEFQGQPALFHLHAMLIAMSRRDNPPDRAMALFFRIWSELGQQIAPELSVRWLISAATTFADCGQTADQRACGMGLSTMFDMIKMHDSERRVSGRPNNTPFRRTPGTRRAPLAFGMAPYSLKRGDADRVMLARLWQLCERDATIRPLGMRMLRMAITDRRSIFGRLQKLRPRKPESECSGDD